MRRSKLSALARSITLLASVGAPCLAHAADLLPTLPEPPPPLPIEIGGSWYLRGDVGVGALRLDRFSGTDSASFRSNHPETTATGYYKAEQKSLGDQAFAGVGVGYQFNDFLRGDVTAEYRTGAALRYAESYDGSYTDAFGNQTPGRGLDFYTGHLSSVVTMANGYVDLGTWYGVTPFVGGGAGAAFHKVSGLSDMGAGTAAGGAGQFRDKDSTSFAWAIHAGLAYSITPNLKLEAAYRYLNLGTASTSPLQCYNVTECPGTTYKFKNIDSHDVKIGFRYFLGGASFASLPPLAPDYAPGPLVRKY